MKVSSTKSTLIRLDKQDIQEAIAEYINRKYPEMTITKGEIKFNINVHEDDKLMGAELTIIEKQKV